jgi:hypothetical protein
MTPIAKITEAVEVMNIARATESVLCKNGHIVWLWLELWLELYPFSFQQS